MYRKLLIANDGSEGAQKALTAAIYLAKRFRSRLHSSRWKSYRDSQPLWTRSWKRSRRPAAFSSK
jgi:nucleotide-binding universal stress UspA family protein